MTYHIELAPNAYNFLEKLVKSQKNMADRLKAAIDELRNSPHLGKKLAGELRDFRSLRVGDYRILYIVVENKILIQIVKIGHRRDIYR